MTVREVINKLHLFDKDQHVMIETNGQTYQVYDIGDVHNHPVLEAKTWNHHEPKQSNPVREGTS